MGIIYTSIYIYIYLFSYFHILVEFDSILICAYGISGERPQHDRREASVESEQAISAQQFDEHMSNAAVRAFWGCQIVQEMQESVHSQQSHK